MSVEDEIAEAYRLRDKEYKRNTRVARLRALKKAVLEMYGIKCYYCGLELLESEITVDHLNPRSLGGEDTLENLVPACRRCNVDKGSRHIDEYRNHIQMERMDFSFRFVGELVAPSPLNES